MTLSFVYPVQLGNKLNTSRNNSYYMYNCNNGLPKSNHKTLVPLMHFGNYVQFEHTQRNISLPKQCVSLPKLKPEDPWTQNYEVKQWNLWIFSNNKKWNYASSDPVTCKQRNLDSDQLYSDLYNLLRAHAISAEQAWFSAEQAHVKWIFLMRQLLIG